MDVNVGIPEPIIDKVTRICITGGPCAGKTTSLTRIQERCVEHGVRVFIVPEAATLLSKGGAMINMEKFTKTDQIRFQGNLMKLQMSLEDIFTDLAVNSGEKSLVLCDRGVMDGSAYIEPSLWQALLDEVGFSVVHLRDRRYESVIHLVTAAKGAQQFYDNLSNAERYEGIREAIELDDKIQNGWTGHYSLSIVDNNFDSFEDKILRTVSLVCKALDLPSPVTYYLKYLIKSDENRIVPTLPSYVESQKMTVYETFLLSDQNVSSRLQKRGGEGSFTYAHQTKILDEGIDKPDKYRRKSRQISSREYLQLISQRDPMRKTIKKVRQCFAWSSHYYMLDTFMNVKKGVCTLRIETETPEIEIPPFVQVIRDVKDDPGYSTEKLAKKSWYVSEADRPYIMEGNETDEEI